MMSIVDRDREQNERLDEIEKHLRRLSDRVDELSADVSETRMELMKVRLRLDDGQSNSDLDRSLLSLNDELRAWRSQ